MTTITFNYEINENANTTEEITNNVLIAGQLMRFATSEEEYLKAEELEKYWNNKI